MADDAAKQPIIIKKVSKGAHGHHGGAWKIAYADFVTAMMAFFLLLWLLNSVTQEQLEGISNYFAPVTASTATSGSGDILGGKTVTEEGAASETTSRDSVTVDLPPPKAGTGGEDSAVEQAEGDPSEEAAEEKLRQVEQEQFEDAKEVLEETLDSTPQLRQLQDSLMIDNTPEGLRIQVLDQDGLAMFPSGSAKMYLHTRRLLELVSKVVLTMSQQISISGHTDAVPYRTSTGYSNWELSADRANSARRELVHFKVPEDRMARVVGKAATEPLLPEDPKNARNRRLSIILLRGTGTGAAPQPGVQEGEPEVLPGLREIKRRQLQGGGAPALVMPTPVPEAQPALPAPVQAVPVAPKVVPQPEQKPSLPGLEEIKKRQLQEQGSQLKLQPRIEAQ